MSDLFVIDNTNAEQHARDTAHMCGCLPRREVYGALPFASAAPMELIPWEAMPDLISDQAKNKNSLVDIWQDSKIEILNQGQLNYCWAFSGVMALMLQREVDGLPFIPLSPSSVAGPVVNYQNCGWYIEDCLKRMCSDGASSTEFVPETTCNAHDFKPGWKESASMNKVTMWQDVGSNAQAQNTKLLRNQPLPVAHSWWSHAIVHLRLTDDNPKLPANNPLRYGRDPLNSWGPTYGKNGLFHLTGQHSIADQSYGIMEVKFMS